MLVAVFPVRRHSTLHTEKSGKDSRSWRTTSEAFSDDGVAILRSVEFVSRERETDVKEASSSLPTFTLRSKDVHSESICVCALIEGRLTPTTGRQSSNASDWPRFFFCTRHFRTSVDCKTKPLRPTQEKIMSCPKVFAPGDRGDNARYANFRGKIIAGFNKWMTMLPNHAIRNNVLEKCGFHDSNGTRYSDSVIAEHIIDMCAAVYMAEMNRFKWTHRLFFPPLDTGSEGRKINSLRVMRKALRICNVEQSDAVFGLLCEYSPWITYAIGKDEFVDTLRTWNNKVPDRNGQPSEIPSLYMSSPASIVEGTTKLFPYDYWAEKRERKEKDKQPPDATPTRTKHAWLDPFCCFNRPEHLTSTWKVQSFEEAKRRMILVFTALTEDPNANITHHYILVSMASVGIQHLMLCKCMVKIESMLDEYEKEYRLRNSGFWMDLDGFGGVEDTMWSHLPHESAFNLMRTCKALHHSGKSQGRMLQFEPVARRHDHVASEAVDLRDEMHLNGEESDDEGDRGQKMRRLKGRAHFPQATIDSDGSWRVREGKQLWFDATPFVRCQISKWDWQRNEFITEFERTEFTKISSNIDTGRSSVQVKLLNADTGAMITQTGTHKYTRFGSLDVQYGSLRQKKRLKTMYARVLVKSTHFKPAARFKLLVSLRYATIGNPHRVQVVRWESSPFICAAKAAAPELRKRQQEEWNVKRARVAGSNAAASSSLGLSSD